MGTEKVFKRRASKQTVPVVTSEKATVDNVLRIHQDASFYLSSLTVGGQVEHNLNSGRKAYLFVIDGEIKLNGNIMQTRDAAMIEKESLLAIKADKASEIILIDLPERYAINN